MLDHQGCLPGWAFITEGKVHEGTPVKTLRFAPGTIRALDRGYNDYGLFGLWCEAGVDFVLKQNLKVKTFVGTSANAVKVQMWTALIAIRLLKRMPLPAAFGWSMSNLAAMLRMNLLTYRDLWTRLDAPYVYPAPDPPE